MKRGGIIIYNEPRAQTSVSCLPETMAEHFPQKEIQTVNNDGFLRTIKESHASIAIIPGIWSEDSQYFNLMGGDSGQRALQNFVRNGGILMTICAGSYLVSQKTEYLPPWGKRRERTNQSALFNALALGPLQGMGMEPDGQEWYDGVHAVQVTFKTDDGSWKKTKIAYGNGPALLPYEDNHNYEILARYKNAPHSPAAAAWQSAGKGAALWLGVLPHIGWQPLEEHPSIKKVWRLMTELKPYEPERQEFWNGMMKKVRDHLTHS